MVESPTFVLKTVLLFTLLLVQSTASGLDCESSGYCSVGRVQSFSGEISSSAGLRAALKARSFKNEIIISIFTARHMQGALQFYNSMRRQGLSHLLLLSTNGSTCASLLRVLPELGCGWATATALQGMTGFQQLWHLRIAAAARAVRLGYNVMVADTDVVFFRDPYAFLKQPPFRDTHFLTHREPTHPWGLNCGTYYMQNARPDGPVAWLLAEVADRQLRWLEDGGAFLRGLQLDEHCMTWDQELFDIAFGSAVIGRPVLGVSSIKQCVTQDVTNEDALTQLKQLARRHVTAFKRAILQSGRRVLKPVPANWSSVVGSTSIIWTSATLRVPNAGLEVSEDLGGRVYPAQRGAASLAFVQQLREDSGAPMWPDPEDALQAAAAAAAVPETFALLPDWFVFGWRHRGRQGFWEARGTGRPVQQVLGHMLYVRVTPNAVAKHQLMRYLGQWNWTLHAMHKGDQLYVASTPRTPLPRLLAYDAHAVGLDTVGSHRALQKLMRGLMQAAVASGRAVLWPDLPCNASRLWVAAEPGGTGSSSNRRHSSAPLSFGEWLHPYGPDLGALRCFNISYASGPCLFRGAGVTQAEFVHMAEDYARTHGAAAGHALDPGRHNTAHLGPVMLQALAASTGRGTKRAARTLSHVTSAARPRHLVANVKQHSLGPPCSAASGADMHVERRLTSFQEQLAGGVGGGVASRSRRLHASHLELGLVNPDEWPQLRPREEGTAGGTPGLSLVEGAALREALAGSFDAGGEHNVAGTSGGGTTGLARSASGADVRRARDAMHLDAHAFVQALELSGVAGQQVVYLSHPISVDLSGTPALAATYKRIEEGCVFLADG